MTTEIPTTIDIDLTYRTTRARWLRESAPRRTLADWFGKPADPVVYLL